MSIDPLIPVVREAIREFARFRDQGLTDEEAEVGALDSVREHLSDMVVIEVGDIPSFGRLGGG